MVRDLGLSERLGPVGYTDPSQAGVPPSMRTRPFSEETQRALDEEVAALLRAAEERALGVVRQHRSALDELVERLLEDETVDGDVVYELLGREVPHPPAMVGDDDVGGEDDGEDDGEAGGVADVPDDAADDVDADAA
jgi:cell division protease FtsH